MGRRAGKDAFEARYMSGEAVVRHRDKRVSRGMTVLLSLPALFMLVLAVFMGLKNATLPHPVPPGYLALVTGIVLAMGAVFLITALTFAVLRTVVTDRELVVKYGLWGPRIALDRITSCRVVPYRWTRFGGWGIRRGTGGVWAYVPGPGDVVEVRYTEGGRERTVQVGAADAAMLAAEIERGRAAVAARRIDVDTDADGDAEAEAELLAAEQDGRDADRSQR